MRSIICLICTAACAWMSPSAALAEDDFHAMRVDGQKLYALCSETAGATDYALCLGYVMGVVDEIEMRRVVTDHPGCVPKGILPRTLVDLALKYLRDHPEKRDLAGSFSVEMALWDAYPACLRTSELRKP